MTGISSSHGPPASTEPTPRPELEVQLVESLGGLGSDVQERANSLGPDVSQQALSQPRQPTPPIPPTPLPDMGHPAIIAHSLAIGAILDSRGERGR
ncbi:uncharacterized protein EHS24_001145 [Apiotrichum porosum]|uniref:Uncharacterized protein n=1 Tax=Apiotrichum porosum TaxID=105984 RepID=A0A427XK25_9TREE|nr:uncharacterized protein EHS24_001145 [Apiotrichum porosum]RSH79107.1 hypothetical protein EHS24_001145 [Apiotrichum porosum]